jgi:hypothetical protein
MTCIHRTTASLVLLSLLLPGINQAGKTQDRAGVSAARKTFTISGNTVLSNVPLRGLPGNPISRNDGRYSVQVEYGWSGTVTPTKEGYIFEPPSLTYTKVIEDLPNQDYVARVLAFIISGNAGASSVRMLGLPGDPVTDKNGFYTVTVPYGWTGTVVPNKEGCSFEPAQREYSTVMAPQPSQDYEARVRMLTISDVVAFMSGSLREPIAGVKVTAEPGGNSVMTDAKGRYAIQVPYGWTGRLVFSKEGLVFDPDSKPFTDVTSDIVNGIPVQSSYNRSYNRVPATPSRPPVALPAAAGSVFVIPTAQVMPDRVAETAEDLRIMLQILRDKLSEPRLIRGAFVNFGDFFGDRDRALEAFYLQGSAAVFVLEMDSPFAFAPVPPGQGEAEKDAVDPVWQRARERLTSPQNPALRDPRGLPGATERMDFQQFKEDLLQTLRHAANLRDIEPNESVIVTIIAHEESSAWPAPAGAGGSYGGGGGAWFEGSSYSTSSSSFGPGGGSTYADSRTRSSGAMAGRGASSRTGTGSVPAAPATVLTIQAKKADIDTFAKGGLTFEQFQQRVKTFTY